MKARKSESSNKGFTLTEQNLRRILDVAKTQLDKIDSDKNHDFKFVLNLNGIIFESNDIDEVVSLENQGSSSIKKLELQISNKDTNYLIDVKFNNKSFDEESKSVYYSVNGEDRDWVFVTSSLIEERIEHTLKSENWNLKGDFSVYLSFLMIGLFVSFLYTMNNADILVDRSVRAWDYQKSLSDYYEENSNIGKEIKDYYESGHKDFADIFIRYVELNDENKVTEKEAKAKYDKDATEWADKRNKELKEKNAKENFIRENILYIAFLLSLIPPLIFYFYTKIINYVHPLYVFCWGDGKVEFEKRDNAKKYILGTVIAGLLISIVSSIIVNQI